MESAVAHDAAGRCLDDSAMDEDVASFHTASAH